MGNNRQGFLLVYSWGVVGTSTDDGMVETEGGMLDVEREGGNLGWREKEVGSC